MSKPSAPLVSVIIPALNEAERIEKALSSIGGLNTDIECIVVDGGSHDQTCEIVRQWPRVKLITLGIPGRAKQMNIGASYAKGSILLFMHADCELPRGAINSVRNACAGPKVVGGSFCLGFRRRHWMLQLCSLCSRINHPLTTYGDQAQFIRQDVFQAISGFSEWPLMEDLEIQYRLRRQGRLVKIRQPIISSDRRYRRLGPVRHQLFNILLVMLYLIGVQPEQLVKWYKPTTPTG